MTHPSILDMVPERDFMEVYDISPSYQYFMVQPLDTGQTRIWGAFQTFARFGWDEHGKWAFPKDTVLFLGGGDQIRCRAGLAPRRLSGYARQHEKEGFVHLTRLLDKTGRRPDTADVRQHYPNVDEAVQKFLFWYKLGKKTS